MRVVPAGLAIDRSRLVLKLAEPLKLTEPLNQTIVDSTSQASSTSGLQPPASGRE
jgi:hypothetical protein